MPRILVAEDERTISHLVCSILRRQGYDVIQAFDVMQTLMVAMRAPNPDAIVLDIHMPGGTGLQAMRQLKMSSKTALIPVVLLSGSANSEERREVEALGVSASLHKPVDPTVLLHAVAVALGRTTSPT